MIDTTFKAGIGFAAALLGVATVLPHRWQFSAERAWSYAGYNVGYRMLSVQVSCGNLAVSGVPFVVKAV
jgi:hypothetical protein